MSSSKGVGFRARDITRIFPPEIARFLFTRTDYREAIDFNPVETMAIPDIFDEYDRCWMAYNNDSDPNLATAFELSQVGKMPIKDPKMNIPRFRDIANFLQFPSDTSMEERFSASSQEEKNILKKRVNYAKYWLENYAPQNFRITLLRKADLSNLDKEQKDYLKEVVKMVGTEKDPEKLQLLLYNKAKDMEIDTKKAFKSIYLSLIGKDHGPKAAWFLLEHKEGIDILKKGLK